MVKPAEPRSKKISVKKFVDKAEKINGLFDELKSAKLKTYVLTVSKNFLGSHPQAGKPTGFKDEILSGNKKHTIRGNYPYWAKIISEVNSGRGVLSIRQWSGLPYRSKQVEIAKFNKLGCQKISISGISGRKVGNVSVQSPDAKKSRKLKKEQITTLANNDGLSIADFKSWFSSNFEGIIIHFTDLLY